MKKYSDIALSISLLMWIIVTICIDYRQLQSIKTQQKNIIALEYKVSEMESNYCKLVDTFAAYIKIGNDYDNELLDKIRVSNNGIKTEITALKTFNDTTIYRLKLISEAQRSLIDTITGPLPTNVVDKTK